jgi:probable HAF family extracellular repeat protein
VSGAVFVIFPASINPEGAIAGWYSDVNFVGHGLLQTQSGTLTAFDVPGAGITGRDPGTYAVDINPEGKIVGMYTDANDRTHGFLRSGDGTFTTFDPPGSIGIFNPFSFGKNLYIKPDGVITGTYFEPISGNPFGGNWRVFVLAHDGSFTTFDAATYPPCCIWSFPSGISPGGGDHGLLQRRLYD